MANKAIAMYEMDRFEMAISMPKGSQIIHVDTIIRGWLDCFHLWAIVDTDAEQETRYFRVIKNCDPIDFPVTRHIGSFTDVGNLVMFHVFEVTP